MEIKTIVNGESEDKIIVDDRIGNATGIWINGNKLVDSGSSDYHIVNSENDTVQESTNGGDNDIVSSTVSYTLTANVENLILADVVKKENINGVDCLVYGNPEDHRWNLDANQDNDGVVKVVDATYDQATGQYSGEAQYFMGDCGVVSIENILIQAGKITNDDEETLYTSTLNQFSDETPRDLRQDVVLTDIIAHDECKTEFNAIDILTGNKNALGGIEDSLVIQGGHVVDILARYGIGSTSSLNHLGLLEDIAQAVKEGKGVILSVDSGKLWGQDAIALSADHMITVTGVACNEETGNVEYFYICDSGNGDVAKRISIADMRLIVAYNSSAIITNEALKNVDNDFNGTGNELDNKITGNDGNNTLLGQDGDDSLYGGNGADTIRGGEGNDLIYGYENDATSGEKLGNGTTKGNYLYGDEGDDIIWGGGAGKDHLYGGANNDEIHAAGKKDSILIGGTGDDKLYGSTGNDILYAGDVPEISAARMMSASAFGMSAFSESTDHDILMGGSGKDVYVVGDGDFTIIDSDGQGVVLYNGSMLSGGVKVKDADYYTDDNGNVYTKNGSTLNINGTLTIDNYSNGNVGITLCEDPPTPPDLGQGDYGDAEKERRFDPLVLDMDGDGIELTSLANSTTYFDLNGDGIKEKTGWVNKDDALLVLDKNANGNIDDISELFGSPTQIGFEVLRGQDTNLDGVIDKNDLNFGKLKVWNDLNSNGFADEGELRTLDEAGVKSIDLNYSKTNQVSNGNTITEQSTYNSSVVLNDGTTRAIVDANFLVDQFDSKSNYQTPIDPEIALLPTLKGYGVVEDLHIAMNENSELAELVKTIYESSSLKTIYENFDDLLTKWAGADSIDESAMRGAVSAQKLAVLENFYNNEYSATINGVTSSNVNSNVASSIENAYTKLKNYLFTNFAIQTLTDELPGANYSLLENKIIFSGDAASVSNNLAEIINNSDYNNLFYITKIIQSLQNNTQINVNDLQSKVSQEHYNIITNPNNFIHGTLQNDTLSGNSSTNIFLGDKGNDKIFGSTGNDSYIFNRGDGQDVIVDNGGNDTLVLEKNITKNDVEYSKDLNDLSKVRVSIKDSSDEILSSGLDAIKFSDGTTVTFNEITQQNLHYVGTDGVDKAVGLEASNIFDLKSGDDNFVSFANSNDTINAGDGNDIIVDQGGNEFYNGGLGNDYIEDRDGNDTYTFNRGDGQDTILDLKGSDVLKLGEGISLNDLTFQASASNLVISFKDSTDKITISNWFEASGDKKIEKIQFSNNTYITSEQVDSLFAGQPGPTPDENIIYGTDGDDYMVGNYGTNVYSLGKGNDTVKDLSGTDTYIFNKGDGQDVIDDTTGLDIVKLGAGIKLEDIEFVTNSNAQDLTIRIKGTEDSITITNGLSENRVELFEFADGTIKNILDIKNSANFIFLGTTGNDNINSTYNNHENTYYMGAGNDYVYDRSGNDIYNMEKGSDYVSDESGNDIYNMGDGNDQVEDGAVLRSNDTYNMGKGNDTVNDRGGSDTYTFNLGDGQDYIIDEKWGVKDVDTDVIKFGEGITKDDLIFSLTIVEDSYYAIEIAIKNTNDKITWRNELPQRMEFADGTFFNQNEIDVIKNNLFNVSQTSQVEIDSVEEPTLLSISNLAQEVQAFSTLPPIVGTDGNDSISGNSGDTVYDMGAGNDYVNDSRGNDIYNMGKGNDKIYDEDGNDIFIFNLGDGQDYIERGFDNETNIIKFGEGITKNDLNIMVVKIDNRYDAIEISIKNTNDKITWRTLDNALPSKIEFADASYLTQEDIRNALSTIIGTNGNDLYTDSYGANNTYTMLTGNDTINDGSGNDTYNFNLGDGQDSISDSNGNDTIKFGDGITKENIEFGLNYDNGLVISIKNSNDRITWANILNNPLEKIEFADGTSFTQNEVKAIYTSLPLPPPIIGTNGNDIVNGNSGNTTYDMGAGNDSMNDSGGNDTYYMGTGNDYVNDSRGNDIYNMGDGDDQVNDERGSDIYNMGKGNDKIFDEDGNDTFIFNLGDGQDYIARGFDNETNIIKFGEGITKNDLNILLVKIDNSYNAIEISIKNTNDKITWRTLDNVLPSKIEFADASCLTNKEIDALIKTKVVGTDAEDMFFSPQQSGCASRQEYNGGKGSDNFFDIYGSDTYIFNKGDGQDVIFDVDSGLTDKNIISFGNGITQEDIIYTQKDRDLIISLKDSTDQIAVKYWFASDEYKIDRIEFADGSSVLGNMINPSGGGSTEEPAITIGTGDGSIVQGNNADNLVVSESGDSVIDGGSGADIMIGGPGDNTYIIDDVNDKVSEYADGGIDEIKSGISYTLGANLENLTLTGSANLNGIGNDLDNVLTGNSGNNVIDGGVGIDTMSGGLGNDTYIVDNIGDVTTEGPDKGIDEVKTSVSYTLSTNVENLTLTGTDNLNGTGNELNNIITGNAGSNIIDGGVGEDIMIGGLGNDTYIVDNINDVITEFINEGVDTVKSNVSYTLLNSIENIMLTGSENINAAGNELNNIMVGNSGNNIIDGGAGADIMSGGLGNDTYIVDNADDVIVEKADEGIDEIKTNSSYTLGVNIENLTLIGSENINATGNELNNVITGNSGDNIIDGGAGSDAMSGGLGNDTYYIDNSNDVVVENAGEGIDTIYSNTNYTLGKNIENLTLSGTGNINATGNEQDNVITGTSANNVIDGGTGVDTMSGGLGNDTYIVDNIGDVVVENANEGTDTVNSSISYTLKDNIENLTLTGSGAINGTGNALSNIITGNSGNNIIDGGLGNDTMIGGLGNDTYIIDSLNDVVFENANEGIDTVISSFNYTLSSNLENLTLTGTSTINGTGNESNNYIVGNSAANTLIGGAGNDTLLGGLGNDYLTDNSGLNTYLFNLGDGKDTIIDAGTGKIVLGSGITTNNTKFTANGSDILITFTGSTDSITLKNQINTSNISSIVFTNGTTYSAIQIESLLAVSGTKGTTGNDRLTPSGDNNVIYGLSGNDSISPAGWGNDTIYGGSGTDTINDMNGNNYVQGGDGNDSITSGYGNDIVDGGSGNDTIYDMYGSNNINGGDGNDLITSGYNNDIVYGGAGNDTISDSYGDNYLNGGDGNDLITAGYNNDTICGGVGNDTISGGDGNDVYLFAKGDGIDRISDSSGSDLIKLDSTVTKNKVAVFMQGTDLTIDYGSTIGQDKVVILGQANNNTAVEKIQLSDGKYISNTDVNQLIQTMTAYASGHGIQMTSVADVKNNADLMNLVAGAWHS